MGEVLDISAVADAVAEATALPQERTMPEPLPTGWVLKASQSNPGYYYYFHIPSGLASWHPPMEENQSSAANASGESRSESKQADASQAPPPPQQQQQQVDLEDAPDRSAKRRKNPSSSSSGPKEVRVLHILKKHKGSRRPSSWRQAKITASIEEAKEELEGFLEILQEEEGNPEELRATFEELARTESDCSSAKRGGDLGFFGRRKMQPPFEEASFALKVGELTKEIVETSSGVHLILRIG